MVVAKLSEVIAPNPLTMDQVPVPGVAALPARVKVVVLSQWFWSTPALAAGALIRETSSKVLQLPLTIVQRITVVVPTVTPVTVEVAEFKLVIFPAPLILVHVPVPGVAVLPAKVKVVELVH